MKDSGIDQEHREQGSGCSYKRDPWLSDRNGSVLGNEGKNRENTKGEGGGMGGGGLGGL